MIENRVFIGTEEATITNIEQDLENNFVSILTVTIPPYLPEKAFDVKISTDYNVEGSNILTLIIGDNLRIKKTGQTQSYVDFDDGYYQTGVENNYVKNNNIIIDNVTNLMWQDDTTVGKDAIPKRWSDAKESCESLSLGGYSDWRLPTIEELRTIVSINQFKPALDPIFKNIRQTSSYWSSTEDGYSNALAIYFYYGFDVFINKSSTLPFRCVRGNKFYKNFTQNIDEIVIDEKNRLLWEDLN